MSLKAIRVYGTSMMPVLKNGYVFVEKGIKDFNIGDMVLYNFMGRLYIHRIYKIKNNIVVISNDDDIDFHEIDKSSIIGKVVGFLNGYKGYVFGVLSRVFRRIKKALYVNISKTYFPII